MEIKYQFKMEFLLKTWHNSSMKDLNPKIINLDILNKIQLVKDYLDLKLQL